jgi:hypothetical protein
MQDEEWAELLARVRLDIMEADVSSTKESED